VSPRLPRISGDDAARALERVGFQRISHRGSHLKLRSDDGRVDEIGE
jgi:predicted RNA binding protein YcfA (HicA-like mRNA interferase family)